MVNEFKCKTYLLRIDKKETNNNKLFDYDSCDYRDAILVSAVVGEPAYIFIKLDDDIATWHRIVTSNVVSIDIKDEGIIVETNNSFYKFMENN